MGGGAMVGGVDGVRRLYSLEGLDSDEKKPMTTAHEFTLYVNELESVSERQNIWHDLCFIAGREGLLEIKMDTRRQRMKIETSTRERGPMLQRTRWSTLVTVLVASLALVFFLPSGAAAGTIQFLEGLTEGAPTVVILSADIIARGGSSASCATAELCSVTINGPAGNTGAVTTGNVNIFDPAPPAGVLSDTITFAQLSSALNVAHFNFTSDSETGPALILAGIFQGVAPLSVTENGDIQEGTRITWSTPSGPVVDIISFRSDVETVPEPATLLLLGSGLIGAALWGRRRLGRHVNA